LNCCFVIFSVCSQYQSFLHCKLATDSTLPQSKMDSIHSWCAADLMLTKLKSSPLQGKVIQLTMFTNCVKNPQLILTASMIWEFFGFCIPYSSLKLLALIHAVTYCFCTVHCLLLLYFILFRSKLEYTLPACNITTTNASKLEYVRWKFAALSLSHYFSHVLYSYAVALELCSYILYRWQGITFMIFLFIIHVFPRSKFCPSRIDNSSLQFLLVILEISPSFLQDIKIGFPLDKYRVQIFQKYIECVCQAVGCRSLLGRQDSFQNDLTGMVTEGGVVKVWCVHAVPCVGAVRILFCGT